MAERLEDIKGQGFLSLKQYLFGYAVKTKCVPMTGGMWTQRTFSEGWCISCNSESEQVYTFEGAPVDGVPEQFLFVIKLLPNGKVTGVCSPPKLYVVK